VCGRRAAAMCVSTRTNRGTQPYDGDKRFGAHASAESSPLEESVLSAQRAFRRTLASEQQCSGTARAVDGHRGHTTAAQSQ